MQVRAYQKYVRTSPRKLRLAADAVKKFPAKKALTHLQFMNKRAAVVLAKVLKQAISNAVNNHNLVEENLEIKQLEIEKGPTLKRWQPVSRGRAHSILKRMSHIKIILESKERKSAKEKTAEVERKSSKKKIN